MKLYKKKILNVNVGKCLLVSLITFVIRYFYANVYLGFHNSLVTITEGVRSQIYFGGILIDHSFDLISLSFFAIRVSKTSEIFWYKEITSVFGNDLS